MCEAISDASAVSPLRRHGHRALQSLLSCDVVAEHRQPAQKVRARHADGTDNRALHGAFNVAEGVLNTASRF